MTRIFVEDKLLSLCIVLGAMLLTGCAGTSAASTSTIPTPARATIPAAGSTGANEGNASNDLTRTNQGGNVTVEVTWQKATPDADALQFKVVMDTHSVDLDGVDLMKSAVLRTDAGKELSPDRWDAPAGGHHRSGTLAFPSKVGGTLLVGGETKFIELVLSDVAGVKERSFKWQVSS